MRTSRIVLLTLLVSSFVSLAAAQGRTSSGDDKHLPALDEWFRELGSPEPSEGFGAFVARSARIQQGISYDNSIPPPGDEFLRVKLDAFECVSFIESALAVARCAWNADQTPACFTRELTLARYRDGSMGDYSSRLHYFVDWIGDNEGRGRLENLTPSLGGAPVQKDFFYITRRVLDPAPLGEEQRATLTTGLAAAETELSRASHSVLDRDHAPEAMGSLEDGDVVAFVRDRPGLMVHHAGFVYWADGTPRLLHASSYHQRVVITVEDVSDYLLRRPNGRGIIVARPLPPTN